LGYRKPPGAEGLKNRKFITLWDGGVYENLGVERLFRVSQFASEIDFLITSDASAPLAVQIGRWSHRPPFYRPMLRLADVATEQGRSYRVRALLDYLVKNPNRGAFIKIGNTPRYIFDQAKKKVPLEYPPNLDSIIDKIWLMETTLRKLSDEEFSDLKSHGYWTAKATFEAWLSPATYSTVAE
jgi:NTE family protein